MNNLEYWKQRCKAAEDLIEALGRMEIPNKKVSVYRKGVGMVITDNNHIIKPHVEKWHKSWKNEH
jgi:hypothetical protein